MSTERLTAIDTSVAVPLLVVSHPCHKSVAGWALGRSLALSGHALIETFSVLTRLPGDARVSANDAVDLVDGNFAPPLILSERGSMTAHRELAKRGIFGGASYDGLVALAALEHGVVLATRDARARATYEAIRLETELLPS